MYICTYRVELLRRLTREVRKRMAARRQLLVVNPPRKVPLHSLVMISQPNSTKRWRNTGMCSLWSFWIHHLLPPHPHLLEQQTLINLSTVTSWMDGMPSLQWLERDTGNFHPWEEPSSLPWPCCTSCTHRVETDLFTTATTVTWMWRQDITAESVMWVCYDS